jgi:hypothetical protein
MERLRGSKAQAQRPCLKGAHPCLQLRAAKTFELVFPTKSDVSTNQACLNWVKQSPNCLQVNGSGLGNEEGELSSGFHGAIGGTKFACDIYRLLTDYLPPRKGARKGTRRKPASRSH